MTIKNERRANRYWGDKTLPTSKAEFFNAITSPAPSGTGTVATIRMYGPIDSWGGYWGISTKDIGAVLDALPDSVTQIILRINSPGGEVFEGVSILNMLRAHKASVTAVVDGLAASAASVVAAGCDDTVMSPGTQMMIHSPWIFAMGDAADLRKTADVLDTIESSLIEIYTSKAGEKDWKTLLAEETWLNATDAVSFGLANRVAVIPDAGETETVGEDAVVVIPDEDAEDAVDALARARILRFPDRAAAAQSPKPPSSTEPVEPNQKEDVVAYGDLTTGLRDRLGISDASASDDVLLAAVDQVIEQATTPPTPVPPGATLIDSDILANLQADAQQGRQAREEQNAARRESVVNKAITEGRITPASRATWLEQLEANESGTTALIASLAVNTIPVEEMGHAPAEASGDDAAYYAMFPDERPTAKEA